MAIFFHHIHVKTEDWRAVVDWYQKHLGAKLVFPLAHGPDAPHFGARLQLHGTHFHVTSLRSVSQGEESPFPERYGFEHVAMFVDDEAELDQRVTTMKADGAKVLEDAVFQGLRVVYVEVPGPILIEFILAPKRPQVAAP
jgi:catechol 2,3-dioxygenase-like lactoylglutathione lyase family enzyme